MGSNHEIIPINDPRSTFTWKSNTIVDGRRAVVGGGVRYRGQTYPDPSFADPAVGGGVFDVRYGNGSPVPGIPIDAPSVVFPPLVLGVKVNDGSAQRSMVTGLSVTISRPVTIDPGGFELRTRDGTLVDLKVSTSLVDGNTVAVLTFTGAGIVSGSLADGQYTMTVHGDKVHDAQGQALDGVLGGDYVDAAISRFFGDVNGDGTVDNAESFLFKNAINKNPGQAGYLWFFDFNGDGRIDTTDFAEMKKRTVRSSTRESSAESGAGDSPHGEKPLSNQERANECILAIFLPSSSQPWRALRSPWDRGRHRPDLSSASGRRITPSIPARGSTCQST